MLWEKEKLLITGNFSFSCNVFRSCLLLMLQNEYPWSKCLIRIERLPIYASEIMRKSLNFISACHDIDQWCPPIPGETLNLPIFGTVLQVT